MTSANLNYTQRRKIKSSFIDLAIVERTDEYIRVRLNIDGKFFNGVEGYRLVLDAFERGLHERKVISTPAEEEFDFNLFPAEANIRFKVRQVATGSDTGRVLAATADIRPKEIEGQVERLPFIVPEIEDLGDLPWRIEWEGDIANPKIILNRRLDEHFGNWRNPVLQALYLPVLIRDLLSGIVARVDGPDDLDDDTIASNIFDFCKERFDLVMPSGPFHGETGMDEEWLTWVEQCVMSFSETKWRKGKSLMDIMMESAT